MITCMQCLLQSLYVPRVWRGSGGVCLSVCCRACLYGNSCSSCLAWFKWCLPVCLLQSLSIWQLMFLVTGVVQVVSACLFAAMADARRQPWSSASGVTSPSPSANALHPGHQQQQQHVSLKHRDSIHCRQTML